MMIVLLLAIYQGIDSEYRVADQFTAFAIVYLCDSTNYGYTSMTRNNTGSREISSTNQITLTAQWLAHVACDGIITRNGFFSRACSCRQIAFMLSGLTK